MSRHSLQRTLHAISFCLIVAMMALFSGCVSRTYVKSGGVTPGQDLSRFKYAMVSPSDSQSTPPQAAVVEAKQVRFGSVDNLLEGLLMRIGLSVVARPELERLPESARPTALIAKWAVAGRTNRFAGGYSQQVIVTLSAYDTGDVIYRGTGEHMGHTEIDDVKGALEAAMAPLIPKGKK